MIPWETGDGSLSPLKDRLARVSETEAYGLRHIAFRVVSVDKMVAELESKGIPCEPVRTDTFTGEKMTFFRDPDGLPIEIRIIQTPLPALYGTEKR